MARPVTMFTGQWADLPLEQLAKKAKKFGYDGLELACWGDHFEVDKALEDQSYCKRKWELLEKHGLGCFAISNHLVGQAICDNIDERHKSILPPRIWGDGKPEGVRSRAAAEMMDTARAARKFFDAAPAGIKKQLKRVVVNGFTGSSIWPYLYSFPPNLPNQIANGYQDFAKRFKPILDVFEEQDVYFALEVHPTEIAFDISSTQKAIEAVGGHKRFCFNYDPSHLGYQGVDYVQFIRQFRDRIVHVHMKDVYWSPTPTKAGVFGGHMDFGHPDRFWDFRSLGHGRIDFEAIIRALNEIQYDGPLSVEWEDGGMDREHGATEACAFVRKVDFPPSAIVFDAQFARE
ncbi:MAG TPA: sugar phosphate isomerase/epimerase family protein [Phycisphaerae bacterium]|jgi:sugar phosphate isomerase/epimerase|nr:sugar phosphate isomerase/epimerase [Phycisphaerae bacterium]HOB76147.1 sugar phosphate isomerase/epimerase family protein [Phycisphaerae bacterium]HOJ56185.1 sugar phosphate isomerase/epimerase family protein [Phycisphaerae bacterium]HOL28251.1 sugar phosphate isomerase/epimerase family protein [Phycisphaerae bacterium]HPP22633.1 sugar phosphate isomerase/epimerase family protein [Phycisphaerae bacterium]